MAITPDAAICPDCRREVLDPADRRYRYAYAVPTDLEARALHEIARYALVEPTMEQLNEAGLTLTDEQYLAIYAFALKGAEGLARFCESVCGQPFGDGDGVSCAAVEADRA